MSVDKAFVQSQIEAAGPVGHLVVSFRDYLAPVLDDKAEAVKDDAGETIHAHDPLGHVRVVSGFPVALIDTHVGIGDGPGKSIRHLVAFADIDRIHPDLGELLPGELAAAEEAPEARELEPEPTLAETAAPPA